MSLECIKNRNSVSRGPLSVRENLRQIRQGLPGTHHCPQLRYKCKHSVFLIKESILSVLSKHKKPHNSSRGNMSLHLLTYKMVLIPLCLCPARL